MALNDWEIQAPSTHCSITGRKFEDGEVFYTLLFREPSGFRRQDLCEEAWQNSQDKHLAFSTWKSKFEAPPPKPDPLPANDAESLLRRLIEENAPQTRNARFILAVMLERKRTLRPRKSSDDGILVYEHAKTGEVFCIEDPKLTLDQVPAVQREVAELLQNGLPR